MTTVAFKCCPLCGTLGPCVKPTCECHLILATGPTRPGYQHSPATYVEGREAPGPYLPWANAGGPNECQHGYAAGIPCPSCDATVEACARARVTAEHWREVARAVLAAAGRGGK